MKALSVRQPWAWAILNAGKDIENRSWSTSYRGALLIHAGAAKDAAASVAFARIACRLDIPFPNERNLNRGGFIGIVDLIDCVQRSDSPWFENNGYGFVLKNPRPTKFVHYRGQLSLFDVPGEIIAKVLEL